MVTDPGQLYPDSRPALDSILLIFIEKNIRSKLGQILIMIMIQILSRILIWVNFSRIRLTIATESVYLSLPGVRTDGFIILILGDFVTYTTVTVQD